MTVTIHVGDALEQLRQLPEASVHCCITSPPYFGLRDYGHAGQIGLESSPGAYVDKMVEVFREVRRVLREDGTAWINLGDSYAGSGRGGTGKNDRSAIGKTAREAANTRGAGDDRLFGLKTKDLMGIPWRVALALQADGWWLRSDIVWNKPNPMPESVTSRPTKAHEYLFLMTKSPDYFYDHVAIMEDIAEGTVDRMSQPGLADQHGSDRVPGKTNGPMKAVISRSGNTERKHRGDHGGVEGSRANQGFGVPWASDGSHRPQMKRALEIAEAAGLTDAHFEAIRACGITDVGKAKHTQTGAGRNTDENMRLAAEAKAVLGGYYREFMTIQHKRNKRSVWTISTKPFKGAHFATFPPEIPMNAILAGTSSHGVCPSCGAPWVRDIGHSDEPDPSHRGSKFDRGKTAAAERGGENTQKGERFTRVDLGWAASCDCDAGDPVPPTVLDPFFGAGTTGVVAQRLNRNAIGIELNPDYAAMARERIDLDAAHGYQDSLDLI